MGTQARLPPPVVDPDWPTDRWLKILERIDHRQSNIGLRYWGPPIWLEVTMTGPDADMWPAITDHTLWWNWQSSAPCVEVDDLVAAGADDDLLVEAVGRYSIENLILNAVHEIGEWFRFDGRRIFPAHNRRSDHPSAHDVQGNGPVELHVAFEAAVTTQSTRDDVGGQRLVKHLARTAAASRFTYLPGTTIAYEAGGPVIRYRAAGDVATTWRSAWSASTIEAARTNAAEVMALVMQDVHRALVSAEADRICRAFHVDNERPWRLVGPNPPLGADPRDSDATGERALSVSVDYADITDPIDQLTWDQYDDRDALSLAPPTFPTGDRT